VQPLAILFGAALTVVSCLGFGGVLLGSKLREPGIRFIAGAALLSVIVFGLCTVGWAYPSVFLAVGAIGIGCLWRFRPPVPKLELARYQRILALFFILFFILYLFSAMAPETSPDGAGYHLTFVGQYLRWHGFLPLRSAGCNRDRHRAGAAI